MQRYAVVVALVALVGGLGCGPIVYVNEVTRRASERIDEARDAEADRYAPYWFTRAIEYQRKAREVAAHADFQGANRFGRLASEAAAQAIVDAEAAKQDPSRRPRGLQLAPAKDAAPTKGDR
jgi:hypothetical protein